jgi:diguanylate cyclase (GGDEF)-like protein/putative nucleotidyltransferase with HDIG domain
VFLSHLRRAAIERLSDHDVRWRSLGALYIAGGLLADATLLVPVDRGSNSLAILGLGMFAVVCGIALIAFATRLPRSDGWLSAFLAQGTVLVTLAVIYNRTAASPIALIYVWVGFDGFFFFTRRHAFGHLAWVGVNYAIALAVTPAHGLAEGGRWIMIMGTVGIIGALADVLRSRSEELIGRLSDVARTDSLTGLLNRRGFEERIADELERARRSGQPASLVVGDLDHFKAINDRFGHHRGDEALREFARLVTETKRVIDGAARIGGEEFALVLPDTDEHGAYLLAERLRRRVRRAPKDTGMPLSVSFGIATFPRHAENAEDLLRQADQSLYLAKRLGRDRSVIYSREVAASFHAGEDDARLDQLPAVLVLAETLDLRDTGTAQHSQTVGRYAEQIAASLGLPTDRVQRVRLAGLLHDIGKIGVPDPVLQKPGPLDDEEWAEMRRHPELGARILAGANLDDIADWVLAHHERPDGRGYPAGLGEGEIPLEARILSVADAFEAMTSDRVYRTALPFEDAVAELRRHAGTQFDLDIVEAFIECLGREALPA